MSNDSSKGTSRDFAKSRTMHRACLDGSFCGSNSSKLNIFPTPFTPRARNREQLLEATLSQTRGTISLRL